MSIHVPSPGLGLGPGSVVDADCVVFVLALLMEGGVVLTALEAEVELVEGSVDIWMDQLHFAMNDDTTDASTGQELGGC